MLPAEERRPRPNAVDGVMPLSTIRRRRHAEGGRPGCGIEHEVKCASPPFVDQVGQPLCSRIDPSVNISSFDDLLRAARRQPEPQRLLFVSVDKIPEELSTFAALVEESRQFGHDWAIVFVASLPGRDGRAPTSKEADQLLQRMIESIKAGSFGSFIPFDRQGEPMLLS